MASVIKLVGFAFVLVCAGGGGGVQGRPDENPSKHVCMTAFNPRAGKCCKEKTEPIMDDIKKCFGKPPPEIEEDQKKDSPPGPPPCDADTCAAKQIGYLKDDGSVDKEAMKTHLAKLMKPETVNDIEKYCINGDLSQYGPEDFCDLIKMRHCIQLQYLKACSDWDSDSHCSDVKSAVQECSGTLD